MKRLLLAGIAALTLAVTVSGAEDTSAMATCNDTSSSTLRFGVRSNGNLMGYYHARVTSYRNSKIICRSTGRSWFTEVRLTTWHITSSRWRWERWLGINPVTSPPYDYAIVTNVGWVQRRDGKACRFRSEWYITSGELGPPWVMPTRKLRRCT